ncbi:MAG TPA: DUF2911 domain-containing protein [Cyclobacteriaceae bacterium]|jgi:tetratricopeptide (TPR) repeat protein|nr:DUF2911 domain-containing protein [Cyclobacteriaceae bacterium]
MKTILSFFLIAVGFASLAQIRTPAPSPAGSASTVVGLTDVKIDYSRPRVKGRKIFGEGDAFLQPNGKIWRAGANDGTFVSFSDDVTVEGNKIAAGKYLLFAWPGATEWTLSLYKDLTLGGNTNEYDKTKEAANFKVKAEKLTEKVEMLTYNVTDVSDDNKWAKIQLAWENTSVKFSVGVDFDAKVMKAIEANTKVNPGAYATAANYYLENGKDLNKALEWMDLAIASNPKAFWNVHAKAKIQKALGDKKGAITTAQQSLDLAKNNKDGDFGYVKLNEDLIKTLK